MIPRTLFDSDHRIFRDSVARFLKSEAEPFHRQWEKEGQVSREVWHSAGEQGFLAPTVPEAYGGSGADFRYNAIVVEEVARLGLTGLGWSLHSDIGVPYLINYGSEEQKKKYLPRCVNGECIVAIAMTEPGGGSDLQSVRTTAVRDGNDYVINGSKTFITNGVMADLVIVVAKTDPALGSKGISLFLVDSDTEGFTRGRNLEKLGLKAQDTAELFFQDARVPAEALLGAEGRGFACLMQDLPQERLSVSVAAVAVAESILLQTIEYVSQRRAFGQLVAEFQNTQFKLAEMSAEVTAVRVFCDKCLELHLAGSLDTAMAARLKLLATEIQGRVIDECLQLHGGYGYMWEYPVARAYADARVQRIYAGSNEIMKLIIARDLMSDSGDSPEKLQD